MRRARKLRRDGARSSPELAADSGPEATDNSRDGRIRLRTIDDLDGRTRAAKRALQLVADLEADLGGPASLSTAQRELIRRCAVLGAIVGDVEAAWLEKQNADLSLYGMLVDRQRRLFETLGLHEGRKPRDVTLDYDKLLEAARAGP